MFSIFVVELEEISRKAREKAKENRELSSASNVQVNITPSIAHTVPRVRARDLVRDTSSMELTTAGKLHTRLGSSKLIGQMLALGVWYHNNASCSLSLQVSC